MLLSGLSCRIAGQTDSSGDCPHLIVRPPRVVYAGLWTPDIGEDFAVRVGDYPHVSYSFSCVGEGMLCGKGQHSDSDQDGSDACEKDIGAIEV